MADGKRGRGFVAPTRSHDRDSFFKYVTAETAKIILATRKLRWSSPELFNDTFDVMSDALPFTAVEIQGELIELHASIFEAGKADFPLKPVMAWLVSHVARLPESERRQFAADLRDETLEPAPIPREDTLDQLRAMWREIVPSMRVLCVSEAPDITPMWHHYADANRGVVLELGVIDEVDSALLVARPVSYQDGPPAIGSAAEWAKAISSAEGLSEDVFREYQYYKAFSWSYEREWRCVSFADRGETGLYGDYRFHDSELLGVYFGSSCSVEDRADLAALLCHGLEHVKLYEAYPDAKSARFAFRELAREDAV